MQQNFLTVYIPDGVYARQENGRSSNMACFRYCPNETRLRSRIHLNGKTSIIKMKRKECSGENNQVKIAGMPKVYSERLISHSCPHGMCVRVRSHQYACRAHTHTHTRRQIAASEIGRNDLEQNGSYTEHKLWRL